MRKKVLLTSILYRPNIGGIENSLYHLALEYKELGYSVEIVSSDRNNQSEEHLDSFEKIDNNISCYRYKSMHKNLFGVFRNYLNKYKILKKLSVSSSPYDMVLARSALSVIACRHAGLVNVLYLLPGVSLYQSSGNKLFSKMSFLKRMKVFVSNKYNHYLQYIAVRLASKNLVFSNNMLVQVKSALNINVNSPIVKPGIDSNRFHLVAENTKSLLREKLNLPLDKKIVLGLGRFVKAKGFEILIEALKYLPKEYVVCLVGHGIEEPTYNELALHYGVSEKLIILPATAKPEEVYQASDFFAMTSNYEPLGQTIIEAQACGLPIIALNPSTLDITTAIDEVTIDFSRELCNVNDGKGFSNSLLKMNQRLETGGVDRTAISEYARKTFSWHTLAKKLISI
ncbi:glycosyltransferase family 4 protein [Vibrio breoganii]